MTRPPAAPRRPVRAQAADSGSSSGAKRTARAAAQRERILAAARTCFIAQGFHAASMANIAQTARMSPGLMYRYFPSKHAIVLAIIERQLREARAKIAELHASTDIASRLLRSCRQWECDEAKGMNVALFLAMTADARRDPQIARALRTSDRATRGDLVEWLVRRRDDGGRGLTGRAAKTRAVLLQCVFEGLAVRTVREPDLDVERLRPALAALLDRLLAP